MLTQQLQPTYNLLRLPIVSHPPSAMPEKPVTPPQPSENQLQKSDAPPQMDHLSHLQNKLEDLSVMFYTYIGIIQREAAPINAPQNPTSPEDPAQQLAINVPQYARDIITCNRDLAKIIDDIDAKMTAQAGQERNLLNGANFESIQAGGDMSEAVDDAHKLLSSVRDLISAREQEP